MNLFDRLGLAIARPRWALTLAADRRHAGRSGSDFLWLVAFVLAATELRWVVQAGWLGFAASWSVALRALTHVITHAFAIDLAILVIAAFAIYLGGGKRRELGRAFDLACVAALPLLYVELAFAVVVHATGLDVPPIAGTAIAGVAYAWTGVLVALALPLARRPAQQAIVVDPIARRPARIATLALAAVALAGVAVESVWLARNADDLRPMQDGDPAPRLVLPAIAADGALAAPRDLATLRGKVVIVDFWATWCGPCLAALPHVDALARQHPEIAVLAVNLDDPKKARALATARQWGALDLVYDDGDTSQRYGVTTIPHTVVVDRTGVVRGVFRGESPELPALVERLAK